jgi:predicted alpha/beta-hydrolase family hydrolase
VTYLLLTHGAGSNRNAPLLVALDSALSESGIQVVRYDLAFRQDRVKGPPRPGDAARDREGLRAEILKIRAKHPDEVWLGGQSYGGRQCSMLAAETPGLADRLLLLSYPLHPPGKPERLRTAHFPNLQTPALFVQGSRDPFGSIDELKIALALIPAPLQLLEIEGAGHDLGRNPSAVAPRIASALLGFNGQQRQPDPK